MAEATIGEALNILSKVSVNVDNRLKTLESAIGKTIGSSTGGDKLFKPGPKKKEKLVKEASPVIVTDFGRKAEQDLAKANASGELEKQSNDPGKGGMGFIKKLIGPALLILGGLAALVTGIMSDGPLKGLFNILSKGGIIGGVKLFQKMAGKQLAKFTGQFAKIMPKNLFKNVIETAKGFLGNIGKFLLAPFKKLAGKGGAKALFGTIGKLFTKFLKPVLKRIPGIGSLISWGFAISRFKQGDLIGGLIDVASGIATLFPGIGTGISIGLDVLNAFIDVKKGKEDKVKPGGAPGGIGAFFGKIKNAIMNNFPIKNLMQFYTGVGKVFSGDFKEGFTQMAFALPFMKPLGDFIFGKIDEETVEKSKGALASLRGFFAPIKDKLLRKVLNILPETILGVSVRARVGELLGINMGPVEDDMEAIKAARDENTREIYGDYAGMSAAEQVAAMEADGSLQKIDDGIITKNGQVVIPSAQDTVYAMKDGGPLGDALNKTPKILSLILNVEIDSLSEMRKQNAILVQILQKNDIITVPAGNNDNVDNYSQSGDPFRQLQMS